jgi:aryl-alcohol dehydrogenase-like predicted oxidoreductase
MKLALGTVQFGLNYGIANAGCRVTTNEVYEILQSAQMFGMDTLDTAIDYGESEVLLGQFGIRQWKTITKLPVVPTDCCDIAQWVHIQVQQSMIRLGIKQLHGLLLHKPNQLLEPIGPSLYKVLLELKEQGIVNKIGVSVYSPTELDRLFECYALDLVQAPLNILDRRLMESGWLGRLHAKGVEVHTRSAFLQGLLLMSPNHRPAKFNRWSDIWNIWDKWLVSEGVTPLEGCLRYICNLPGIDRIIVGVDSRIQLNEIIKSSEGQLISLPEFCFLQDTRLINPGSWSQL